MESVSENHFRTVVEEDFGRVDVAHHGTSALSGNFSGTS
jgi:hypothetical protein